MRKLQRLRTLIQVFEEDVRKDEMCGTFPPEEAYVIHTRYKRTYDRLLQHVGELEEEMKDGKQTENGLQDQTDSER